jgi:hypothetical protein
MTICPGRAALIGGPVFHGELEYILRVEFFVQDAEIDCAILSFVELELQAFTFNNVSRLESFLGALKIH